jgi:hypothetical protein
MYLEGLSQAEAYELGYHWHGELRSERRSTYWTVDEMSLSIRELNQFCIIHSIY